MTIRCVPAGAVAVALVVVAAGCSDPATRDDPIRIGVVATLSGDLALFGADVHNGTLLAINEINAAGGVDGRPLIADIQDDGTTAEGAQVAYSTLLNHEVPVILGPPHSGGAVAIIDQVRTGRTLTLSGSASSPELTDVADGGYFFRTVPPDSVQGVVLADLIEAAGVEHLCLVMRDDPYGNGLGEAVIANLPETITKVSSRYPPTAASLDDVMPRCEAVRAMANSAALFVTFEADGRLLLDSAAALGWSTKTHEIFLVDGNKAQRLVDALANRAAFEGVIGTAQGGPDPSSAEGQRLRAFQTAFTQAYGHAPGVSVETTYDAAYLAAAALLIAGADAEHDALRAAMASTTAGTAVAAGAWADAIDAVAADGQFDYLGASGDVDLDADGELEPPFYIIVWSISGGTVTDDRVVVVDG